MRNPYQPPVAAVADVPGAGDVTRPIAVRRAVQMLWATMAFGFLLGVIDVVRGLDENPGSASGWAILIGLFAVGFGISFWIYGAIYAGRNWARVLLLVLVIVWMLAQIVIVVMLQSLPAVPPTSMRDISLNAVQFVVTTVATVLLFMPSANRWYRAVKAARA